MYVCAAPAHVRVLVGLQYGAVTARLDLSNNRLRSIDFLEGFHQLRELILDKNELSHEVHFPVMPHVHTLTLNKVGTQRKRPLFSSTTH